MTPLVTAVLPTRGRAAGAIDALTCIEAQTWLNVEIIILDDDENPSIGESPASASVYWRLHRNSLGEKLNIVPQIARGEFIVHFYDDDLSAPNRIEDQVNRLIESGKAVTSYRNLRFTDGKRSWINHNWPGGYGTSLCYRRVWARTHSFPAIESEDWYFVSEAMRANQFIAGDAGDKMLCSITNNCVIGQGWEEIR